MRGKYNMMCYSYIWSYERFSPFYGDGARIYIIIFMTILMYIRTCGNESA